MTVCDIIKKMQNPKQSIDEMKINKKIRQMLHNDYNEE